MTQIVDDSLDDAAAKLAKFNRQLDDLLERAPDDEDLASAIELLKNQVQEKGLEKLDEIIEKVMGKEGSKIAKNLALLLDDLTAEGVKKNTKTFKKIWGRTVGKVFRDTASAYKTKDPYKILGASLSFLGRTWEALSVFWDESQKAQPLLKFADKPVKAVAVALYVKGAPVLGIVKAAEFVGRTAEEYSTTKNLWHSIKKAAKDTAKSIYRHFMRLTVGEEVTPALEAFAKKLGNSFVGSSAKNAKKLTEIILSQDKMQYLENMTVEEASRAAGKIHSIVKELGESKSIGGVDLSSVAGIVIPSVAKGLDDEKTKALVKAVLDPEIQSKMVALSPTIRAQAIERIVEAAKEEDIARITSIASKAFEAAFKIQDPAIDVEAFEKKFREDHPDLHSKLKPYFDQGKGRLFTVSEVKELLDNGPELSRLPESEKTMIIESVSEYSKPVDINGLGNHLSKHNPELLGKLEKYFASEEGKKFTIEEFAERLKKDPVLKKLKTTEKEKLMRFASDYAVEKVLSHKSVLGEKAELGIRSVTNEERVRKGGFASRFKRSKKTRSETIKSTKSKDRKVRAKRKKSFVASLQESRTITRDGFSRDNPK